MSDLIDRQQAIDALEKWESERTWDYWCYSHKDEEELNIVSPTDCIRALPSVQPETHEKRTKTHACDCISRQAAIDAITEIDDGFNMDIYTGEVKELLRDLPSAEPKTADSGFEHPQSGQNGGDRTTDDLISRQAAIDILAAMQGLCGSKAALVQNSKIWQQIKDLPSVQPRMKGKWVRKLDGVYCSVCHQGWDFVTGVPIEVEGYNFCPTCGACMSEGEEDEAD